MRESILHNKAFEFATKIVLFYQDFSATHKDNTLSKQLLRSGTSIGANLSEATYGNSKADFIAKLHISLKETSESLYWLKLLHNAKLIEDAKAGELISLAEEIKAMLVSSLNTAKK